MKVNYNELLVLDLKSIFNFDNTIEESNANLKNFLKQISEDLKRDRDNIKNRINDIKSVKTKLDFIYSHIFKVDDLKLQFAKKIKMKKRIENYLNVNPNIQNSEFVSKVLLRFKFDILSLNSVELGFQILLEIKKLITEFSTFLKLLSKKIIDSVYHPERINFDAEIILLFIDALVGLKKAKNQYFKDISSSKLIKILMKTFILRKTTGDNDEYTEQTLIKKLSDDYILKKNINGLNEFKEKVQEFVNDISKMPYIKGLPEELKKKVQN